jgi:hypothetical protein
MEKLILYLTTISLMFLINRLEARDFPNDLLLERLVVEHPECFARDDKLLDEIIEKASQGDPSSVYCLAERLYFGHGVQLDHAKAIELFEFAGINGYSGAMSSVCELSLYGLDVEHDHQKAFRWCSVAAGRGNSHAQTLLAEMYLNGTGTNIDYSEALKWAKVAANNGQPIAQYYVGMIYYKGLGIPANHQEAKKWLSLSAESNVEGAIEVLNRINEKKRP